MRLGCPNCDAQYEVDDAAIPATGRDVQCSNCGHAWFQLPAGAGASATTPVPGTPAPRPAAPRPAAPRPARPAAPPRPADPPAPLSPPAADRVAEPPQAASPPAPVAAAPAPAAPAAAVAAVAAPAAAATAVADAATPAPQTRRTLDDNLMAILREEAAREAAERKAEAERALHVQQDLGVPDTARRPVPAAEPLPEPAPAAEPTVPPSRRRQRRELLPDIEEINSTLRPGMDQRGDMPAFTEATERRRGFSTGFLTVIVIVAALALVYVFAPRIAEAVPSVADALAVYVAAVDTARIWLDDTLQWATGALEGLTAAGDEAPG